MQNHIISLFAYNCSLKYRSKMVGPTGVEPVTHGSLQLQTVHHPFVSEACETTGALSGDHVIYPVAMPG